MTFKTVLTSAFCFFLFMQAPAVAQGTSKVVRDTEFKKWYANESGWLSGNELIACKCAAYDTDGDNEVTADEYKKGKAANGVSSTAQQGNKPAAKAPVQQGIGVQGAWWFTTILYADGTNYVLRNRQSGLDLTPNGRYVLNTWLGGANNMRTAGTYTVAGKKLTLREDGGIIKPYTFTLNADGTLLTLRGTDGSGYIAERSKK